MKFHISYDPTDGEPVAHVELDVHEVTKINGALYHYCMMQTEMINDAPKKTRKFMVHNLGESHALRGAMSTLSQTLWPEYELWEESDECDECSTDGEDE